MSSTTSAAASATSSAAATLQAPGNLKVVGIILAIASGVLIGSSFVFKKKGLIQSQAGGVAGEGVAYLKSPLWWTGMIMMILGELCNFAAYAFVEAIVVTPMGALSVVICAILSSFFLKEKLSMFGWIGCGLCIIGSVIIALNGPQEQSIGQIREFQKLFLSPGFLVYASVLIAASLVIIIYFAPRYGTQSMLWYISVCSMIGGISVSVTTGLGSAIVTTAMGDNQFKYWFIYFLMVFIVATLVTEIFYLNKALALFNTAMVTPTYYVIFTFFSIITTIVLFKGLAAPAMQIITLVMGFLVICFGITILQLSKVDPTQIKQLDRRSTLLLQAARRPVEGLEEKNGDLAAVEDPGMDALRGSFGTIGSIVRARSAKRMSMSSRGSTAGFAGLGASAFRNRHGRNEPADAFNGMKRHQLYDPPVPGSGLDPNASTDGISLSSEPSQTALHGHHHPLTGLPENPRPSTKKQTIKFGSQDMVHTYHTPGRGDNTATHEPRNAPHSGITPGSPYHQMDPSRMETPSPALATVAYEGNSDVDSLSLASVPSLQQYSQYVPPSPTPRTAPPVLTDFSTDNPFYHPPTQDPFANSPSTTTLSSFPSRSTTASTIPSDDSTISPASSRPLISPSKKSPSKQGHLFGGRGSSSHGRHYPKGDSQDDKDESMALWRGPDDRDNDSASGRDTPAPGTIRLVPNDPNRL